MVRRGRSSFILIPGHYTCIKWIFNWAIIFKIYPICRFRSEPCLMVCGRVDWNQMCTAFNILIESWFREVVLRCRVLQWMIASLSCRTLLTKWEAWLWSLLWSRNILSSFWSRSFATGIFSFPWVISRLRGTVVVCTFALWRWKCL